MSAGSLRGTVAIRDGDKTWRLVFDFNVLCDFEEETDLDALDFVERLEQGGQGVTARQLRILFKCALMQAHPEITLQEAGRLMSSHPEALGRLIKAGTPEPSDVGGDVDGEADEAGAEK